MTPAELEVADALASLADTWSASSTRSGQVMADAARRARRARRSLAAVVLVLLGGGGTTVASVVLATTGRTSLIRESAAPTPAGVVPPGTTAQPLGRVGDTDGSVVQVGGGLPPGVPLVDSRGLLGVTEAAPFTQYAALLTAASALPSVKVRIEGLTGAGARATTALTGQGADQPLRLTWLDPPASLRVGQRLVTSGPHQPEGIPVGFISRLLPPAYPNITAARAEVTPFADVRHPGPIWALRTPDDTAVPPTGSAAPRDPSVTTSPEDLLLDDHGLQVLAHSGLLAGQGPQVCLTIRLTGASQVFGTDCRTPRELAPAGVSIDGGPNNGGPTAAFPDLPLPSEGPVRALEGRAGTSVRRVTVELNDGTTLAAHLINDRALYAGSWWALRWNSLALPLRARAYGARGELLSIRQAYGAGG